MHTATTASMRGGGGGGGAAVATAAPPSLAPSSSSSGGGGGSGDWPFHFSLGTTLMVEQILWVLLLVCYSTIFLLSFIRLFRIWLYRHRFCSFQGAFLLLTQIWCMLRIVFWAGACDNAAWSPLVPLFVYWAPDVLQFVLLSLLSMYQYKLVNIRLWPRVRVRAYVAFAVSNFCVGAGLTSWLIVQRAARNAQHPIPNSGLYFAIVSGVLYGGQVLFLVYYAWRVYRIRLRQRRSLRNPFSTSSAMVCLTVAVFLVFIVKPIRSFEDDVLTLPDQPHEIKISDFFLLSLCEIVPTLLLILMFRAVPSSRVTRCPACFGSNASLEEMEESLARRQQWSSSSQSLSGRDHLGNPVAGGGGRAGQIHRNRVNQNQQGSRPHGGARNNNSSSGSHSGDGASLHQHLLQHTHLRNGQSHSGESVEEQLLSEQSTPALTGSYFGAEAIEGDTRNMYDSDSDTSPFARARPQASTPGTPLYLPPPTQWGGGEHLVPPLPGGRLDPALLESGGSGSFTTFGPRDLLESVTADGRYDSGSGNGRF